MKVNIFFISLKHIHADSFTAFISMRMFFTLNFSFTLAVTSCTNVRIEVLSKLVLFLLNMLI